MSKKTGHKNFPAPKRFKIHEFLFFRPFRFDYHRDYIVCSSIVLISLVVSGMLSQHKSSILTSQGENILLTGSVQPEVKPKIIIEATTNRTEGARAFHRKSWDEAIAKYHQASEIDLNDPESLIYLNNARARKAGDPLTIAVVVPATASPDTTKEVLRGVAMAQEEFNYEPLTPDRLLEVVIADISDSKKASDVADLVSGCSKIISYFTSVCAFQALHIPVNFLLYGRLRPVNVLGAIVYEVDEASRKVIERMATGGKSSGIEKREPMAVLSPFSIDVNLSIDVNPEEGETETYSLKTVAVESLKTVAVEDDTLSNFLEQYLANVSAQLAEHAKDKLDKSLSVAVFYNSKSPYSKKLKATFIDKLESTEDRYIEIDIANENFGNSFDTIDAQLAIEEASSTQSNVVFLALSRSNIDQAIDLAKAVRAARANGDLDDVLLMGGEELYHPATLIEGGSAVEGLVLAVPWSWKEAYELRLMSLDSPDKLPTKGRSLIIAAKIGNSYYVRIFNRTGERVIDKGKDEFLRDEELVQKLEGGPSNQSIDNQTKIELIKKIASSLDDTFAEQVEEELFAEKATTFWEGRRVSWRTRTAYIFTNVFAREFIDAFKADDSDQNLTRKEVFDHLKEVGIQISGPDAKDLYPSAEFGQVSLVCVIEGRNGPKASRYQSDYQFNLIDSEIEECK